MFIPVITHIVKTTPAYPSQWKAKTENGGELYIRYRHGNLQIKFDWENPVSGGEYIIDKSFGNGGHLQTKELFRHLETSGKIKIDFDYKTRNYYDIYSWKEIGLLEFGDLDIKCKSDNCDFHLTKEDLEKIDEINGKAVPPECLICGSEIEKSQTP